MALCLTAHSVAKRQLLATQSGTDTPKTMPVKNGEKRKKERRRRRRRRRRRGGGGGPPPGTIKETGGQADTERQTDK